MFHVKQFDFTSNNIISAVFISFRSAKSCIWSVTHRYINTHVLYNSITWSFYRTVTYK